MIKVYLIDDEKEAIEARDAETNKMLYKFSYRHNGTLIWNIKDSWRRLRANHLPLDNYKEVFKCKCKKLIELPKKVEAEIDEFNKIRYNLKCECGNIIKIECDTLRIIGESE